MRMWLVDVKKMCRKHLLGEHKEIHMFCSCLFNGKKLDGYIRNNLLEVGSLRIRHNDIVKEMKRRNYKHKTPIKEILINYTKYTFSQLLDFFTKKINTSKSYYDLINRCSECRKNFTEV